ncbi:TonB protein C-terminal [Chitinophaga filiformis]|uniref:TonB protein C-terminal n=1 Tax=Chitinophaga filiformis TaxID=104663 RepID=A0A1G7SIW7_CHIFI|nr:TonB protein C-terminal [Chitinophaga filiformis]
MTLIVNTIFLSLAFCQLTFAGTNPDKTKASIRQDTSKPILYLDTDRIPKFKGGTAALKKYIQKNLKWPNEGIDYEGTIIASLVVEKNGKISNVFIVQSACPPCEREAKKFVLNMPDWTPGTVNNHAVRTLIYLPLEFKLVE